MDDETETRELEEQGGPEIRRDISVLAVLCRSRMEA